MNKKKQKGNRASVSSKNNHLQVSQQSIEQSYSGPIPAPVDLEYYNQVVPGAAERIIVMAEKEQSFRHSISQSTTTKTLEERRIGQIFGGLIAFMGLAVAVYALKLGHPVAASVIGGATLLGIVTVFVTGKASESKSNTRKN